MIARDAKGVVSVKKTMDAGPLDMVTGLAVGSPIGLLGGLWIVLALFGCWAGLQLRP